MSDLKLLKRMEFRAPDDQIALLLHSTCAHHSVIRVGDVGVESAVGVFLDGRPLGEIKIDSEHLNVTEFDCQVLSMVLWELRVSENTLRHMKGELAHARQIARGGYGTRST